MVPSFGCMDSYTQPHPYQIPYYPNNYHPSWKAIPPTKHDSIRPPPTYGPWCYGGLYGYPYQTEYHGCCNHGYPHPPNYQAFGPSHAYVPPPGAFCYHGPYPPYAGAFPHYHAPHYTMEQPRYEFDKDMHRGHCCGCSNHVCKQKEDKGVKIEEHVPDTAKKGSDSLTPVKFENNFPYPFLWVPPEYLKNTDCKKPSDIEPKMWNGWYPFANRSDNENESGKTSESLRQGEDVKDNQIQSGDDKRGQFQLPLLWVPNFNKQDESRNRDSKESDTSSETVEEKPAKLKIIPVNLPGNDGCVEKPEVMGDKDNCDPPLKKTEKATQPRNIPVMQIKEGGTEKSAETERKSEKTDGKPMEQKDKSFSDNSLKNQSSSLSSSPKKASKLPPVCLRVEPLPRRKNGSGTSRSPSPPGVKKATENCEVTENASAPPLVDKSSFIPSERASPQNKDEEVKPIIKEIEIREAKELDEHNQQKVRRNSNQSQSKSGVPDDSDSPTAGNNGLWREEHTSGFKEAKTTEGAMCEKEKSSDSKESINTVKETKVEERRAKKELSIAEAARVIQSFYRGFEVRKWEPLKKLRQIAEIRKQVDEISERIHSSPDLQKDGKWRMLIGENIMSLLLQLDTIQGLHPSVRDIRKAVARKLVCLQERLDSLTSQMSEEISPEMVHEAPKIRPDGGCAPPELFEIPEQAECPHKAEEQLLEQLEDVSKDSASTSLIIKDEEPSLEAMKDDLGKPTEDYVEGTPFEMPEQAECPHKAEKQLPEEPEDMSKDDASPSLIIKDEEPNHKAAEDDLGKPTETLVKDTTFEMLEQAECPHKAEEQLPGQPEDVSKDDASPSLIIKDGEPSLEATEDNLGKPTEAHVECTPFDMSEQTEQLPEQPEDVSKDDTLPSLIVKDGEPSLEAKEDDLGKPTEAYVEGTPFEMPGQAECPHKTEEQLPEQPEDVSKDDTTPSLIIKDQKTSLEAKEDDLGNPTEAHVEGTLAMDVAESNVKRLPDLSDGVQDVVDEKVDSKVEPSGMLKEVSSISLKKEKPCELQVELKPLVVEGMVTSALNGEGMDLSALNGVPSPLAERLPGLANGVQDEVDKKADSGLDSSELLEEDKHCQLQDTESSDMVPDSGAGEMLGKLSQEVEVRFPRAETNQLLYPPGTDEGQVPLPEVENPESEEVVDKQREKDSDRDANDYITNDVPASQMMDVPASQMMEQEPNVVADHISKDGLASTAMMEEHNEDVEVCHTNQLSSPPAERKLEEQRRGVHEHPASLTDLASLSPDNMNATEIEVPGVTRGTRDGDTHMASLIMEGENNNCVVDCHQEQQYVHPSAKENKQDEGLIGAEVNKVHTGSEPATLTGLRLTSQKDTTKEMEVLGTDCKSSSSLEEAEVPDVIELLYEDSCMDPVSSESNPSGDDCPRSEAKAVKYLEGYGEVGSAEEKKLLEENEKLREMVCKLLQEGKQQLAVISDLSGRVRGLERKLTTKKKQRIRRHRATPAACVIKPRNVRCVM